MRTHVVLAENETGQNFAIANQRRGLVRVDGCASIATARLCVTARVVDSGSASGAFLLGLVFRFA